MTVPQFGGKLDEPGLIAPDDAGMPLEQDPPRGVCICYQPHLFEHVVSEHAGEEIEGGDPMFDLYPLSDAGGRIGVVGGFGIGAPSTAMVMERLAAVGVEVFLSVGWAGCLTRDVDPTDVVVVDRAIRDEGTSHHYLEPARDVAATERLVDAVDATLAEAGEAVHVGGTWTTDAPYRETAVEVEHYAAEGLLTVDMEAAATFAVARHRGVDVGAAFVPSDYLGDEWDPRFDDAREHVVDLFPLASDALASYLDDR